ncbi:L-dopachrome tautomerase-related protein [Acetobacter thailandicus]|uniref:L-dopachrome tautomerase-related protein n=1 Tax=Acetobacter thailandicus TaxID=1502842 RepID=UPI001BAC3424|nr:L-dopachrome tautomerase-related protein [Acetobacter thailandicus]MBS0980581.1 gluconolactonase [Acetobacter thailandicus]MBS1003768.1 gluconolactonase [Acetobacter thailandicus]
MSVDFSRRLFTLLCGTCLTLAVFTPQAQAAHMPKEPELQASALTPALQSDKQVWDAVVVLPDERLVLEAPVWVGNTAPQLSVAAPDGSLSPYPSASWNAAEGDAESRIISAAGMTLLADGTLWVLDSGVPDHKAPAVAAPKLLQVDTKTNTVVRTITVESSALRKESILSGIAVHGMMAYVPDSGSAALIVVDLKTGHSRRFLDQHPALAAHRPILTPKGSVRAANGHLLAIDASMIAVSPDGQWIYVQPPCGYLSRIGTSIFTDPSVTPAAMEESVSQWFKTPTLGGMTIAPDGTMYWSDVTTGSILSYSGGVIPVPHRLITDPRLQWPATPGLDKTGHLYVPAAQLNRTAAFTNGKPAIKWPVTVYKLTLPTSAPPAASGN